MKTDREKIADIVCENLQNDLCVRHCNGECFQVEIIANHLISKGVTIPVRCGECVHWSPALHHQNGFGECLRPLGEYGDAIETDANDFCSYGEREEG